MGSGPVLSLDGAICLSVKLCSYGEVVCNTCKAHWKWTTTAKHTHIWPTGEKGSYSTKEPSIIQYIGHGIFKMYHILGRIILVCLSNFVPHQSSWTSWALKAISSTILHPQSTIHHLQSIIYYHNPTIHYIQFVMWCSKTIVSYFKASLEHEVLSCPCSVFKALGWFSC